MLADLQQKNRFGVPKTGGYLVQPAWIGLVVLLCTLFVVSPVKKVAPAADAGGSSAEEPFRRSEDRRIPGAAGMDRRGRIAVHPVCRFPREEGRSGCGCWRIFSRRTVSAFRRPEDTWCSRHGSAWSYCCAPCLSFPP